MHRAFLRLPALRIAVLALAFAAIGHPATAQYFGKNKVQYKDFRWSYIQSSHFDVYFSQDGYTVAEFTAMTAESALVHIQKTFRFRITTRIPIIVYNSHNDFQQTNVVQPYLEEGIGGVTELLKNRVIIPFEGDYKKFRHVIRHELVHAVINEMFYGGSIQNIVSNNIQLRLPLWFNEGLAEYTAMDGWDISSDMFLRDATVNNYLPPINYLNGYFAYRGGQALWNYIAEKYGKPKVGEILNRVRTTRSVEQGFKSTIGLDMKELNKRWQKAMKTEYWPDIADKKFPVDYAKKLTDHQEIGNFYNTSPAISPDGDRVAFISDREAYYSLYVMESNGKNVEQLIEGQQTSDFEELNLLTPGLTWSPDGKRVALSSKTGEYDAISIIDVKTGHYEFLPIRYNDISSVSWSPDGDRIAFVAHNSRQADLYVYSFSTRSAERLTNDPFYDTDPRWSPDGKTLYFVSDRGGFYGKDIPPGFKMYRYDYPTTDLYALDLASGDITRLTETDDASETSPAPAPDGEKLLYISDRNGINNIYVLELKSGETYPITNSLSAVYQLSLSRDGNKLVFASLSEAGFDIFLLKAPLTLPKLDSLQPTRFLARLQKLQLATRTPEPADTSTTPVISYGEDIAIEFTPPEPDTLSNTPTVFKKELEERRKKIFPERGNVNEKGEFIVNSYKLSFSPDLIYGNAGYSTFYGVLGTTQMAFSDMLGDHQIFFLTNLLIDLKNSDYALAYYYLKNRIDWGIQGYHSARFIISPSSFGPWEVLYRYRDYGGAVSGSYPFDRFRRVDFGLNWMNLTRENLDEPYDPPQEWSLLLPQLSYTYDNSLWRWGFAPTIGTRYTVGLLASPKIFSKGLEFITLTFDYRHYFRIGKEVSWAVRGAGGGSFGPNAQRFFIGGTENWINRRFATGYIPIENAEDFAFLTPGLPLRGYDYAERIASKYVLFNTEFRFPLVKYFFGGVMQYLFQNVYGTFFADIGAAFKDFSSFRAYARTETGEIREQSLLSGTGFGVRMWFLGFPLKIDVAWAFHGKDFSPPRYYFSLGADF